MADGHIRIYTGIDNSKLDKGIKQAEKKIDSLLKRQQKQQDKVEVKFFDVTEVEREVDEIKNQIDELKLARKQLIKDEKEYSKLFDKRYKSKKYKDSVIRDEGQRFKIAKGDPTFERISVEAEIDNQKQKLAELEVQLQFELQDLQKEENIQKEITAEIEEQKQKIEQMKYDKIKDAVGDIGTSIKGILKRTLKWGLAIFSIRGAYILIRQAASTLSQYNDELRTKIEGIRLAIASALEPAIKKIVDWVITLLKYVNAVSMALFGWDLFKNAKNMKNMSKSAKEIKNSLAGFDEMNVLGDSSSSSGDAGSNFNYDNLYFGEEKPGWIEFIEKNAGIIKDFLLFLLFFGVSFKALELVKTLGEIGKVLGGMSTLAIFGLVAGIAITLVGIVKTIQAIIKFVQDPSWEALADILIGLSITLAGIFVIMLALNALNPVAWIMLIVAAVALLVAFIIKHWEEIKAVLQKGWNWIKEKIIEPIKKAFEVIGNKIAEIWEKVKKKTNDIWGGIKNILKTVLNAMIGFINTMIRGINKIASPIRALIVGIGKVTGHKWTMDNIKIPEIPKLATGGVVNRPTYAQIGESGREAVLPLDRNTQWMDELVKKINASGGTVNVYLDGRLIQRQYNQRQEEFNFATNGGA